MSKLNHRPFSQLLGSCCIATLLLATACNKDSSSSDDNDTPPPGGGSSNISEEVFATEAITDNSGRATINFTLPANTSKVGITAESAGNALLFEAFNGNNGVNYLNPGGETITLAGEAANNVNFINAPSREADPNIDDLVTYATTIVVGRAQGINVDPREGERVIFTFNSSTDGDLNSGSLVVNYFLVGPLSQEPNIRSAILEGIQEMRDIYGAAGVTVNSNIFDIAGPTLLPDPVGGDEFYLTSAGAGFPSVNVYVGTDIDVSGIGTGGVLGISAGIPGPPNPSERSAVAISLLVGSGADGVFNSEETRLLGETFAHECGHFVGLFHPVDIDEQVGFLSFDPLTDTDRCFSLRECNSDDNLTSNLMYFTPIVDNEGDFVPQNRLTDQQQGVLNRYIAVR